ncbi:hypothetical protein K4A83_03980 [Spirulina subsalsa FACHB-351]|uniref:Uncharacterized protein n=1 Tax=Spirulina subsalsa FACHB-351 TaxID=234711 RepID=A0ABT3L1Q7_9CYAN|nr:hypothetical protein [Spirulina subsalsa]MCW6035436.1 hypothetical protein [Spirulina subsalsa FACHB-351]
MTQQKVWFGDIQNIFVLGEMDLEAIAYSLEATLQNPQEPLNFPAHLNTDQSPRLVALSASDGETTAQCAWGGGRGITQAVENALTQLRPQLPPAITWFKLDIVQKVVPVHRLNSDLPIPLERSLYGLAFDADSQIAFLPEHLHIHNLVNSELHLQPKRIKKYLQTHPQQLAAYERIEQAKEIKFYQFESRSFFWDGKTLKSLFRGHRIFNYQTLSPDQILEAAITGGNYLKASLNSEGQFLYRYLPQSDQTPPEYNILRHAGTIYALLELYEVTQDKELLEVCLSAISYLLQSMYPAPSPGVGTCIVENGYAKLGGNALTIIALAKYTELTQDKPYVPIILELGKRIRSLQQPDGTFTLHKQAYPDGTDSQFVSQYYPAEAILSLLRLYRLTRDTTWLDNADTAATTLIEKREAVPDELLPHDHWLLYALRELFPERPSALYLTHAGRIADAIAQAQNRDPLDIDWLGSFYYPPLTIPTAVRMEGLCAAYHLAQDSGNPEAADLIFEALQLGITFQLHTQYYPETALYLPHPQKVLGAFRKGITEFEIRIDYIQHNISSLLGMYRIMKNRG